MIRECFRTNTGIQFQADKLREIAGIDPDSLYPIVQPRPAPLEIPKELSASLSLRNYAKSDGAAMKEVDNALLGITKHLEKKTVENGGEKGETRRNSIQKIPSRSASISATGYDRDVDLDSIASAPASVNGESPDKNKSGGHHPFVSEEEEDLFDALSPIYDQLKLAKPWWVLEFLPIKQKTQRDNGTWRKAYE